MNRLPAEARAVLLIFLAAGVSALVVSIATATPSPASIAPSVTATPSGRQQPLSKTLPGPLTGLPTPRRLVLRRPLAFTVGNLYPSARPEAGLAQASIVFETLVEGGVTRLMPIFLEHDAADVGPIRSARPYFVKLAAGYRALLVHAGGSPASLKLLTVTRSVGNIDALKPSPEFRRDPQRASPDNLFGSTTSSRSIAVRSGGEQPVSFSSWPHVAARGASSRGNVSDVRVDFSTPQVPSSSEYSVDYRYDRTRNLYVRSVGGVPAIDREANRAVTTGNVVVLYTRIRPIQNDPLGRVQVGVVGHGRALVFHDGRVVRGTWSKSSALAPIELRDGKGRPLGLTRGQTWVEITAAGDVSWSSR